MPAYLVSFLFNADRNGWSESWYCQANDIRAALARGVNVASTRKRLCGIGTILEAVRASDVDILGDSAIQLYDNSGAQNTQLVRTTPWDSIYCRVNAGALFRRQLYLRGCPDDWIIWDPAAAAYKLIPQANRIVQNYSAALQRYDFQLRVRTKGAGGPVQVQINGVGVDTDDFYTIFATVPGLLAGDTVKIRKVKGVGMPNLKGEFFVRSTALNSFTIAAKPPDPTLILYKGGGFVSRVIFGYVDVTDITYMRPSAKKTGKAFFVSAGRRKARK